MDETERTRTAPPSSPREITRRLGNSFALMRSIIRWSAGGAASVENYAWHLEGRFDAISRVLMAVLRDPGMRFDLGGMITDELQDQRLSDGFHAISAEGPPVPVGAAAAEVLALLLHELVTNSVEHGALGLAQGGELRLRWRIEDTGAGGPAVSLDWIERGAPAVLTREGFGSMVLNEMLPYQLDATVARRFGPDGVHIALTLPMRTLAPSDGAG